MKLDLDPGDPDWDYHNLNPYFRDSDGSDTYRPAHREDCALTRLEVIRAFVHGLRAFASEEELKQIATFLVEKGPLLY